MFIDRYTGQPKWLNILAAVKGSVLIGATALWMGATYHTSIKNTADNLTHHNQRQVEAGFFQGDAEVTKEFNDYGRIERYIKNIESDNKYPLGWDMLPLRASDLMQGLENRVKYVTPEQARKMYAPIAYIERRVKEKAFLRHEAESGYVHPSEINFQVEETENGKLRTYITVYGERIATKNLELGLAYQKGLEQKGLEQRLSHKPNPKQGKSLKQGKAIKKPWYIFW